MFKIKIDKTVNFLMLLYQKSKKQNSFPHLIKPEVDINKADREFIKSVLRDLRKENKAELSSELLLSRNNKLDKIYQEHKELWENYWENNIENLEKIKKEIEERINNFDLSRLKDVERFFCVKPLEEVEVYVCMGNTSKYGTGNSFKPDICIIFPRNFEEFNEKTLNADFAMLLHEIVHLYQNSCEDKELMEITARAFAPRGILINSSKIDKGSIQEKVFSIVKEAIAKGKSFEDVKDMITKIKEYIA